MVYIIIKNLVHLALKIFCRSVDIKNTELLNTPGPLLITANHPNSFLDAIIIGVQFKRPVHFLARGDAFNKPLAGKIFGLLNMIPIYRLSEGRENLSLNDAAFRRSKAILSTKGTVLIFIEGICVHSHVLQPFKKGAARIAKESVGLDGFTIMPIGIAYNSFEAFGKRIQINIAEPIPAKTLFPFVEEAKNTKYFNDRLYQEISARINVPEKITQGIKKKNYFLPGMIGFVLHFPLYSMLKKQVRAKTKGTVFFDSVLFGLLLVVYPLYLFIVSAILVWLKIPGVLVFIIFCIHPILAWFAVRWNRE